MKKSLLILPLVLAALGSCTKVDIPDDEEEYEEEITNVDVTLNVNVSGISAYEGSHSVIYINSSIEKDGSNWTTKALTQSETNENLWTITFEDVEVDCNYSYNFVYGNSTEPDWSNGFNTEGNSENTRSLRVTSSTTTFGLTATFEVPETKYSFKVVVTPTIINYDGSKKEDLYDSTVVKMWCSTGEVALTKQDDGTWTYDVADYEGNSFGLTPVLETADTMTYAYKYGAWIASSTDASGYEWEAWNATYKTLSTDLTEDTEGNKILSFAANFSSQPDEIKEGDPVLTINAKLDGSLGSSVSVYSNSTWVVNMTYVEDNEDYNYTATINFTEAQTGYTFTLDTWPEVDGSWPHYVMYATGTTAFSVDVDGEVTVLVTGSFIAEASTGTLA